MEKNINYLPEELKPKAKDIIYNSKESTKRKKLSSQN
jgi:hypothetical protein